jgi:predicted nucleic acid-binding protein
MAKMIQLRNVPDALPRSLKARAAMAGMSLSDYLLAEIKEIAERPTLAELRERFDKRKPVSAQIDTAHLGSRRARGAMMVQDASAAVDWLLQTSAGQHIEKRIYSHNETLHAPPLLDLEVTQVLRRLAWQGVISAHRADEAFRDLLDLLITRYPHPLLLRIWQLRHNFSAYDAAYIGLAEKLGAALVTRDGRLASASGHAAAIVE